MDDNEIWDFQPTVDPVTINVFEILIKELVKNDE